MSDLSAFLNKHATGAGPAPAGGGLSFVPVAAKKQATTKTAGDAPGLLDQFKGVTKGVLPGILHLGKGLVEMHQNAGDLGKIAASVQKAKENGQGFWGQVGASARDNMAVAADAGASAKRTGGRFVDLASVPFGDQTLAKSKYGQASKNGTIVGTVIEDAGNVALAGGLATKALGAGAAATGSSSLARAAAGAERVTGAANALADAPIRPFKLAAKGVGAASKPIGEAILNTERGAALGEQLSNWRAGKAMQKGVLESAQQTKRESGEEIRRTTLSRRASDKNFKALGKELGVDPAALREAYGLKASGVDLSVLDQVPEHLRPAVLDGTFGVGQRPSAAALDLMKNPDALARAGEAFAPMRRVIDRREGILLDQGQLSPEQTGHAPMPSTVERLVAEGADPTKLLEGPYEVAPGKYKTPIRVNENLARALETAGFPELAKGLPTTMKGLQEGGIDPAYIPGGVEDPTVPFGAGAPRNIQPRRGDWSKQREAGNVLKSDKRTAERVAKDLSTVAQNKGIAKLKAEYVRTPAQMLSEEIAAIKAKGTDITRAEQMRLVDLEDMSIRGNDLGTYMRDKGYSSIANRQAGALSPDSEFVPTPVLRTYKQVTEPLTKSGLAKGYDTVTKGWKHMQLALSPGWNVGNVLSQPMMMTGRGGLGPAESIDAMIQGRRTLKQEIATGEQLTPARLHGVGGVSDMIDSEEPRTIVGKAIQKGYDLNESADNAAKIGFYQKMLGKGMTEEQAIQHTLRTLGDFSNLSPLEQQVKRVLPFYAWQRHAARMGVDMATRHPWRTAAGLNLTQQGRGDPADPKNRIDPNDPRSSMMRIGTNMFLPIGGIDPFQSSVRSPILDPKQLISSTNPIIKGAAYGLGDINLQRMRMNTRPNGDQKGTFKMPSLKEDAYWLSQQTGAVGRGLFGAAMKPVVRYDQGSPMTSRGKEIPVEGGRLQAGYKPLGLPIFPVKMNEAQLEKRKKDKAAVTKREAAKKKKAKK